MCGTSMAAPAVTGVIALLIEKMELLGLPKTTVHPSTYKALLIHGVISGAPDPISNLATAEFSWGRRSSSWMIAHSISWPSSARAILRCGSSRLHRGATEVKVTLVWDDRPTGVCVRGPRQRSRSGPRGAYRHAASAVPVECGASKETEPARPGVDHLNVVEQVLVEQPAAGVWRIEVRASKIGSPIGGQTYSLVTSVR